MLNTPAVTVFMPVYNGERYLKEAIESILTQTFTDFELLIIDDGSADSSVQVAASFPDDRIRLVVNDRNLGIARTRNKGFELARGKYIAFIDCDDVSAPDRLEKQVAFMEARPEVGLCGSWVQDITADGRIIENQLRTYPAEDRKIKKMLLWEPPLWNPSLIMRRSTIEEHQLYHNPDYVVGEDYDLWIRAAKVTQLANMPEVLHYYRRHDQQVSNRKSILAIWNICSLQVNILYDLMKDSLQGDSSETARRPEFKLEYLTENMLYVDRMVHSLKDAPNQTGVLSQQTREEALRLLWYKYLSGVPRFDLKMYQFIRQSNFFKSLSYPVRFKLWVKCLARIPQASVMQVRSQLNVQKKSTPLVVHNHYRSVTHTRRVAALQES